MLKKSEDCCLIFIFLVLGVDGVWFSAERGAGRVDFDSQEASDGRLNGRKDHQFHPQERPQKSH